MLVAGWDTDGAPPAGAEVRLASFAELVATAVSNESTRFELIGSRARIVAAGDEARRRIERNLHDGTQQRLVALGLDLQRLRGSPGADEAELQSGLARVTEELEAILEDVREVSRGLHPGLLSQAGLQPSLRALARKSPIPVELDVDVDGRPDPSIEIAVYTSSRRRSRTPPSTRGRPSSRSPSRRPTSASVPASRTTAWAAPR